MWRNKYVNQIKVFTMRYAKTRNSEIDNSKNALDFLKELNLEFVKFHFTNFLPGLSV